MPMPNTIPEIAFLLKEVERKYGREVHTSTDFESLSVVIERDINEYISSATLKRLWGYVSLKPAPRVATLDILCHFIGYRSFSEYKHALADKTSDETGFFSAFSISSQDLYPKDRLIIGWAPNKLITVEYKGGVDSRSSTNIILNCKMEIHFMRHASFLGSRYTLIK